MPMIVKILFFGFFCFQACKPATSYQATIEDSKYSAAREKQEKKKKKEEDKSGDSDNEDVTYKSSSSKSKKSQSAEDLSDNEDLFGRDRDSLSTRNSRSSLFDDSIAPNSSSRRFSTSTRRGINRGSSIYDDSSIDDLAPPPLDLLY